MIWALVFWDVTLCLWFNSCWCFEGSHCLNLQGSSTPHHCNNSKSCM